MIMRKLNNEKKRCNKHLKIERKIHAFLFSTNQAIMTVAILHLLPIVISINFLFFFVLSLFFDLD